MKKLKIIEWNRLLSVASKQGRADLLHFLTCRALWND